MHKEIAIAKITAYLARDPAVTAPNLPVRTVATNAAAFPRANDNEYQQYVNFIRDHVYNANQLNAFVEEMQFAKNMAVIQAKLAINGCGNLAGDVVTTLTQLDNGNYTPGNGGHRVNGAFRQPHLV